MTLDQPVIKDRIDAILREVMGDRRCRGRIWFSPAMITVLCDREDDEAVKMLVVLRNRLRMPSVST